MNLFNNKCPKCNSVLLYLKDGIVCSNVSHCVYSAQKTIQVAIPTGAEWTALDQCITRNFLHSQPGRKFIESCRQKLFADHLDACSMIGKAEHVNAAMKGANDILINMLFLATEDSISSESDLAKTDDAEPAEREADVLDRRA